MSLMGSPCDLDLLTDDDTFLEESKHMSEHHEAAQPRVHGELRQHTPQECELSVVGVHLTGLQGRQGSSLLHTHKQQCWHGDSR